MKHKNIIFVIIDGVRSYPGEASDNAGRPEIFEKIAKEGCYFTKVVCTAPSTIMSFTSIFTGFPAGYLARNFYNFKFDNKLFCSLQALLLKNNYHIYSMTYFPEGRRYLKDIIFPVSESYWPSDLKANKNWPNDAIDRIYKNVVDRGIESPFCLFLHYNVRWDKSISERVQLALDKLKKVGLYKDSFLIICSDHGLPDPARKIPRHIMRDLGHDLIVTEDNIRIPLCIRHPLGKAKVVNNLVSTLDLMPTVLDYVGIEYKNEMGFSFWGKSLIPLIIGDSDNVGKDYDNRYIRTECRYIAQPSRITSLRGANHKYVYYHNESPETREHFFDILNDPEESNNLINSKDLEIQNLTQTYRSGLIEEERKTEEFHRRYLIEEFKKNFRNFSDVSDNLSYQKVIILSTYSINFINILVDAIRAFSHNFEPFFISNISQDRESVSKNFDATYYLEGKYTKGNLHKLFKNDFNKKNTLIVLPLDDGKTIKYYKRLFNTLKSISKGKILFVDCNMELYLHPKMRQIPFGSNPAIPLIIRKIYKKIGFYYYRRYWYTDDLKYYLNKIFPFLKLKVKRFEVE